MCQLWFYELYVCVRCFRLQTSTRRGEVGIQLSLPSSAEAEELLLQPGLKPPLSRATDRLL